MDQEDRQLLLKVNSLINPRINNRSLIERRNWKGHELAKTGDSLPMQAQIQALQTQVQALINSVKTLKAVVLFLEWGFTLVSTVLCLNAQPDQRWWGLIILPLLTLCLLVVRAFWPSKVRVLSFDLTNNHSMKMS